MSSTACIKQEPVIARLHDALSLAKAYACAIRDNAQDDASPVASDLIRSVQTECRAILSALDEAHTFDH